SSATASPFLVLQLKPIGLQRGHRMVTGPDTPGQRGVQMVTALGSGVRRPRRDVPGNLSASARQRRWRRGRVAEARACKALFPGSIPGVASSVGRAVGDRPIRRGTWSLSRRAVLVDTAAMEKAAHQCPYCDLRFVYHNEVK